MLLKEIIPSSVMQDLIAYFTNMFTKYKVYSALVTQSGSGAPTAIVLQNTLGPITFQRNSSGRYYVKSSALFTASKTFITFGPLVTYDGSYNPVVGTEIGNNDTSTFQFGTAISNTATNDSEFLDNVLYETSLEIRVYN